MKIEPVSAEEYSQIVELFKEYGFALQEESWFEWKHLKNPVGQSVVYKIMSDEKLNGTVAVISQMYRQGGRKFMAMQAVDGLMGRNLRGKGLFSDVMAFVAGLCSQGDDEPCFRIGFASVPGSMKALANAKWNKLFRFRIKKAVLDASALTPLPGGTFFSVLLKPIWPIYRAWLCRGHGDIDIRKIDRFTEDMNRFQPRERVTGDRGVEFMNWRVIDNPRDKLQAFKFDHQNELVGYVICKELPECLEILEFRTSLSGRKVIASFLKYLVDKKLTRVVDFWLAEGFEQFDKLPTGMMDRGFNGAMFINGHRELGLSDDNTQWAGSYLDSDW
ncbi:MAG: hypothetical protein OES25_11530 [Acidobacteriota bacterium]|nr:hypothetical protein [Acidobacteriota bacterium]